MRGRGRFRAVGNAITAERVDATRGGVAALLAFGAATLLAAAGAQAATITIGIPTRSGILPKTIGSPSTLVGTASPQEGGKLISPINGRIVRWRIIGASGGPFRLRVMDPGEGLFYGGGPMSAPQTPSGTGVEVFPTSLPISAGQTIGLDNTNASDQVGLGFMPGAGVASWTPPLPPGLGIPATGFMADTELAVNADVQPEPTIASVTPAAGSISGVNEVTIFGSDFQGATAVKFDLVPALNFTVMTDNRILAIAPPGTKPGPVDVSVTTLAGTTGALPPDRYTYVACVVPKLKRRSLKAAKELLRRKECLPGAVTRAYGAKKSARVVGQGSKPKTILPPGSKVTIRLAG